MTATTERPAISSRWRKLPIEVEVVSVADALNAAANSWDDLPPWLAEAYEAGKVIFLSDAISIRTLEGEMRASLDDSIIRGVQGELYPIKPEILAQTYERAEHPDLPPLVERLVGLVEAPDIMREMAVEFRRQAAHDGEEDLSDFVAFADAFDAAADVYSTDRGHPVVAALERSARRSAQILLQEEA